jgi:hypothetical protein
MRLKNVMCELNKEGDTKFMWDADNPAEVEEAQNHFEALIAKGYSAFKVTEKGGKGQRITAFDPELERIIMIPRLVGG